MDKTKWTPAQRAAITTTDRTLLVAAAAGSGKTSTLKDRVVCSLIDQDHPVDIRRLLITTYTRAAAAELRQRISEELNEQLEACQNPKEKQRLYRQILNLSSAHICTIDAFCLDAVRSHFSDVGYPASFRIADDAELSALCERVMEEQINAFFTPSAKMDSNDLFSILENNPFADLCDSLTPEKEDTGLVATFLSLYDKLQGFPEGLERLKTESEHLLAYADKPFFTSHHGSVLSIWLTEFCRSAIPFFRDACALLSADSKAEIAYLPSFQYDFQFVRSLDELLAQHDFDATKALFRSYDAIDCGRLSKPDPAIVLAKVRRDYYRDAIKDLRKTFFAPDRPIGEDMKRCGELCGVLYDFLSAFDHAITEEKKARGICGFTDVSRMFLGMLQTPDGKPTPLADEYAAQFDQVYIDEYQDANQVQDRIFALIGRNRRFMVGDIKQSIYGFRGADSSVFAKLRDTLPAISTDPDNPFDSQSTPESGGRIFMSSNFRCDESVIKVTNAVCGHIFRACPKTIDYKAEDDLDFAKKLPTPDYVAPRVQINILTAEPKAKDKDAEKIDPFRQEAILVANQIADLLRRKEKLGTPIKDKDTGAIIEDTIKPKHIAILARSKNHLSEIASAMADMGIPTGCEELKQADDGNAVLRGRSMMYWLNLLRVIDNPHRDIALAELVRAPFPGLTLTDVVTLRCMTEDGKPNRAASLYQAMETYVQTKSEHDPLRQKLASFIEWMDEYRQACAVLSADGLLRKLRLDPRCSGRHSKAFLFLYERARTYRGAAFADLYSFLTYFERVLQTQKKLESASDSQGDGHVTLMTIHGAKGLEFPVCFVVQCGHAFSNQSQKAKLLFEPDAGIAFNIFDRASNQQHISLLRSCVSLAIEHREREDEMRLLYVAMTRAKERLYISGVATQKALNMTPFAAEDRFSALSCSNYLEWILLALEQHPEVKPFYDIVYSLLSQITPDEPYTSASVSTDLSIPSAQIDRYRHIIENRPIQTKANQLLRDIPTKVSASHFEEMLSRYLTDSSDSSDPQKKNVKKMIQDMENAGDNEFERLLAANQKPTATERGTAIHLFLQYCDMKAVKRGDVADTRSEVARLVEEGFISERTAAIINQNEKVVKAFFDSRFFIRVENAVQFEREVQFNRFIPLRELIPDAEDVQQLGDRSIHVQGSIDLLLVQPDGSIELCDYKTDAISDEERADLTSLKQRLTEKHGAQLRQYALAIQDLYHQVPRHVFIYSVPLGDAIEIDLGTL